MSYYFSKTLSVPFEEGVQRVTDALKGQGFGIITEIDVKDTFKKKIGADFHRRCCTRVVGYGWRGAMIA